MRKQATLEKNMIYIHWFKIIACGLLFSPTIIWAQPPTKATTKDPHSVTVAQEHTLSPLERRSRPAIVLRELGLVPVQSGGRVKPLDTLARETIKMLTGREKFEDRDPVELTFSMLLHPQFWENYEFLELNFRSLKQDLGLNPDKKYFSLSSLRNNDRLLPLFQTLQNKEQGEEKLDPYFQAIAHLRDQFNYFSFLVSGKLFAMVPPKAEKNTDKWLGLDELTDLLKMRFWLIAATYENKDVQVQERALEKIQEFESLAMAENPALYPSRIAMEREVHYNHFRPFRWAWILGLTGLILLSISLVREQRWLARAGFALFVATMLMEIYGFYLRMKIAGRPPVTNMYESVIWVAFGCMLFGLIIVSIYRKRVVAACALGFAVLCLIVADMSSAVMDASIHPLAPVLRSNFWLMIHVLTITLGYAAFSLSLALGNLALIPIVAQGREAKAFPLKEMALYAYRAVQVGVILIGAGTILGGVWADYSWGRFWGWDPKETWALIVFLGYVAVIHARYQRMLDEFGFLAACIIAFLLVLMAWYGVNFVLGAGLHSYGFSAGGNAQIFTYAILQCVFVLYAIKYRRERGRISA